MADCIEFFKSSVICHHCGADTNGLVWEHSARIDCDDCGEALFDAGEMDGGTVIILELDENGTMQ